MNMTEKEMRELDAWIFEHVFGARFEPIPPREGQHESFYGCFVSEWHKGMGKAVKYDQGICVGSFNSNHLPERTIAFYAPNYTTDYATALQVLERCAEKLDTCACIWKSVDGFKVTDMEPAEIEAEAPTLPLAICKFAKALYDS